MEQVNVAVLVKPVPDPRKSRGSVAIDPVTRTVRREGVPLAIDPAGRCALDEAVGLKQRVPSRVVTVGMGPPDAEVVLRETLALGADAAYLLSDRALAGSDALATARALAAAAGKIGFDLVLAGSESPDADTGPVGPTTAALLGVGHLPHCCAVSLNEEGDRPLAVKLRLGGQTVRGWARLPALLTFDRTDRPLKSPGFAGVVAARSKPFTVWNMGDLGLRERLGRLTNRNTRKRPAGAGATRKPTPSRLSVSKPIRFARSSPPSPWSH